MSNTPQKPATGSSRARYREFVRQYADGTLGDRAREDGEGGERKRAESREDSGAHAKKGWRAKLLTGKRSDYLRDYLRWLAPHRGRLSIVCALALLSAAAQSVEPLFMRFIVDRVLLADIPAAIKTSRLNMAGAGFLLLVVISAFITIAKDYTQRILNVKVVLSLRRAIFDRFMRLPLPTLWNMKTGGLLSRLSGDVETTSGLLQMAIISPSISVVKLLMAMGVLLSLNWRLALTALAVIPGAMFMSFTFAKRIRPIYRVVRHDSEQIDGRVGEAFSGIRVVRAFRQETRELLAYMQGRHTVLRKELFASRRELVLWTSWGLLIAIVNVVIVWYGGHLALRGNASVGDIFAFQWYTFLLMGPVWNIVNSFSEMQRALAAMERVFEILGMAPDKPDVPGAALSPDVIDEIRFDHVTFAYHEGKPVLHDLDLVIPGGTVVALVGRSGAGKTTVTDLVARFHDPTTGAILVNGVDIRQMRLASYRSRLAIVQQEVFLFDGSVRDNIAYGRHDASEADILSAARRANAHEFIERLVNGYDTVVGERGVKLSGGQKQRLAIARAILADPQLLILDEATSNLDTESEQLIQASLADLVTGRTTFIIAHRLSTIRRADLILVLQDGRVMEQGNHDALMEQDGLYASMVRRQDAGMIDDLDAFMPSASPSAAHTSPDPVPS
ncbi:MAG TPA: ABC transporter ATP-binding protein [Gemmatimonas sp.]|uniref:ABC transporter ATP-binding protein n=1 Tax=Gemmatimonas sp. TaxID=1962908 RepID=UPI002ED80A8C